MATALAPLYALLKKERRWSWSEKEQRAFEEAKTTKSCCADITTIYATSDVIIIGVCIQSSATIVHISLGEGTMHAGSVNCHSEWVQPSEVRQAPGEPASSKSMSGQAIPKKWKDGAKCVQVFLYTRPLVKTISGNA